MVTPLGYQKPKKNILYIYFSPFVWEKSSKASSQLIKSLLLVELSFQMMSTFLKDHKTPDTPILSQFWTKMHHSNFSFGSRVQSTFHHNIVPNSLSQQILPLWILLDVEILTWNLRFHGIHPEIPWIGIFPLNTGFLEARWL